MYMLIWELVDMGMCGYGRVGYIEKLFILGKLLIHSS
jgi:hypothetical protein